MIPRSCSKLCCRIIRDALSAACSHYCADQSEIEDFCNEVIVLLIEAYQEAERDHQFTWWLILCSTGKKAALEKK